jgi:N-acetylmuramoyl-L-alanine amidase
MPVEYDGSKVIASIDVLDVLGAFYHQASKPGMISVNNAAGELGDIKTSTRDKQQYVSMQDVAKLLGARYQWNAVDNTCILTPTVRTVKYDQDILSVVMSFPVKYTVKKWSGKLLVDISQAAMSQSLLKTPPAAPESNYVKAIRTGDYNKTTARVVLDLKSDISYTVQSPAETSEILVKLGTGTMEIALPEPKPDPNTNTTMAASDAYIIDSAEIWDIDGNSFDVALNTSAKGKVTATVDTKRGAISLIITGANLGSGFVNPTNTHPTLRYIKFTQLPGKPAKLKVDIELNRVMRVDTAIYDGSIVASIRPFKQSTGSIDQKIIVIDPGHGGAQKGAVSSGVNEMDVNLSIARKLAAELRQTGATVIMTREANVTLDLPSRPQIAMDNSANFFISIHCNSNLFPNSVSGAETYFHGWNPNSIYLAKMVQSATCESTKMKDRGARSDRRDTSSSGFKVLRLLDSTDIPAILVECGYLNNAEDRRKLIDPVFQGKLAAGIVEGLKSYIAGETSK